MHSLGLLDIEHLKTTIRPKTYCAHKPQRGSCCKVLLLTLAFIPTRCEEGRALWLLCYVEGGEGS
jgi:hypothetical protein